MNSPGDAATSIDRHHLSGDERGIRCKEKSGSSDIESRAAAFEQGSSNNFLLKLRVGDAVCRPHHRPRRDRVDANLRAEFSSERARQHDEPRFGDAVDRIATQWAHAMYVDDVEYEAMREPQGWRRSLGQKQRGLQVGAEQVVPVRFGDFTDRCRVKRRGVVDQNVESSKSLLSKVRKLAELRGVEQISADTCGAVRALRVEFGDERLGFFGRALVVHDNLGACAVEDLHHLGADATGAARDQRHFAGEGLVGANGVRRMRVAHRVRL